MAPGQVWPWPEVSVIQVCSPCCLVTSYYFLTPAYSSCRWVVHGRLDADRTGVDVPALLGGDDEGSHVFGVLAVRIGPQVPALPGGTMGFNKIRWRQ